MQNILQKARHLAEAILKSDKFVNLREVETRIINDPAALELTEKYEQAALDMRAKEERMDPISPEEKQALKSLREQVAENSELQNLMRAQSEYRALMDQVNKTIHETIHEGFGDESGGKEVSGGSGTIILP